MTNNGSGIFGSKTIVTVGMGPICMAAGDFNGDGKLDLVTANAGTNGNGTTLSVLTNNGEVAFSLSRTLTVGGQPASVAVADLNGDGNLDLVCANINNNFLISLTNNGSGSFTPQATNSVGITPICVATADLTGDGKPDLISANLSPGTLSILANNGNGGYAFRTTLTLPKLNQGTIPALPSFVAAADLNGDGRLDLVSANSDNGLAGTLSIFTNGPNYDLGSNTMVYVGNFPACVIAADVNGDGRPDLISANQSANTLTLLINTNNFAPAVTPPTLSLKFQSNVLSVSWASVSPGWSLVENSDLTSTNWLPSGHSGFPIADNGMNKSLTTPFPSNNRFFRLLHP